MGTLITDGGEGGLIADFVVTEPSWFLVVDELPDETREGSPWTADGHRQYVRRFLVVLDKHHPTMGEHLKRLGATAICKAPGLPSPYSPYITADGFENDLHAVAVRFRADRSRDRDAYHWIVTIEYSTNVPEGGVGDEELFGDDAMGGQNNPENKPWHFEWDPEDVQRAPATDLNGWPYLNSANQPFIPPHQRIQARATLVIHRNMRQFGWKTITKFAYTTNIDPFLGAPRGTVLCMPPRGIMAYLGDKRYWRTRWVLKFGAMKPFVNPADPLGEADIPEDYNELENWEHVQILDQGLCRIQNNPANPFTFGMPVPIYRQGHQISVPDLLDGEGQPVVPDGEGKRNPVYLEFREARSIQFAQLFQQGIDLIESFGVDLESESYE